MFFLFLIVFLPVKAVLRLSNRRVQCNPQGGGGESFGAM